MARPPTIRQRTDTAVTAATASLITLAIVIADRILGRRGRIERAATALTSRSGADLAAEADVIDAVAAHRGTLQRGQRHIRALQTPDQRRPRRTG